MPLRAAVEWNERPARDVIFGVIFLIIFVTHLICGFVVLGKKNLSLPQTTTSGSGDTTVSVIFSDGLLSDIAECNERHGNGRMLQSTGGTSDIEIWTVFANNPEIPSVIIVFIVALGVGWLALLNFFTKPIVWATAFIKVGAIAAIGVWMLKLGSTTTCVLCFVGAGVLLAVTWIVRDKINRAADHMQLAINALRAEPSIFAASGILKTAYLVYLAFYCVVVQSAYLIWEVQESDCSVVPVTWAHKMITGTAGAMPIAQAVPVQSAV